jgi:glyoxylase-like metal-dependent hydrolase (beta-lactamase superfamily II)
VDEISAGAEVPDPPSVPSSLSRRKAFGSDFFATVRPYDLSDQQSGHLSPTIEESCENRRVTSDKSSDSTLHWSDAGVEVHKLVVGPYDNNVFVVRCRSTGEAVLIDAANEHDKLLEISSRLGVRRVLETHGHHDHIQAIPAMREAGYEVAVTALDAPMLGDLGYDVFVEHDDVIEVGRLRLRAILNPGHTPGSMSFHVIDTPLLFTGDTLFPGGPGATKFPGGDFDAIIDSIDNLLFVHPADTIVLPGHGADTTIGTERPHLREWVDRGW